ncbi:MAG: prepilin-type N-terminal cleavage/methylation domain-containing protein [Dehalococcoidales bacterium]|nr:prepilin-type N-terminal cleavage/methylation domain-containing protein [Dehalococcoidales bacterium]
MKTGERGYTILELLVGLTVTALLVAAVGIAIYQVYRNTQINRNHTSALHQVETAGYWISRDIQQANDITTSESLALPDLLLLGWSGYVSGHQYAVTYTFDDMIGSSYKKLLRKESIDGGANTTTLICQYVDDSPANTSCNITDGIFYLNITVTVGEGATARNETRTFMELPRQE